MKKLIALLVVVLMGSAAFAAAPVGKMGFGVQGLRLTSNAITMPTLQIYFNENMAGEFGIALASQSVGGTSTTNVTLAAGIKMPIMKQIGSIQPLWGVALAYTSNPAMISGVSNILLALSVGAEYFVTPNFSIEGNLVPLAINSNTGGAVDVTTISLLNSAAGLPAANVGVHLYI
jgi:hypothetical protein